MSARCGSSSQTRRTDAIQRPDVAARRESDHGEAATINRSCLASEAPPHQGIAQQCRRFAHERGIGCTGAAQDHVQHGRRRHGDGRNLRRQQLKPRAVRGRTGHREHQCRRLAEFLDELNRSGAFGQIGQRIELDFDVVEFLAGLESGVLVDFGVHDREAGPRGRRDFADANVLGDAFLDFAGDELFDSLGTLARPRRNHSDLSNGYVRILAFGHCGIRPDPPCNHADQQHPRHMSVLDKEASDAVPRRIRLRTGRHGVWRAWDAYWISFTTSPLRSRFAPDATICWPAVRPSRIET